MSDLTFALEILSDGGKSMEDNVMYSSINLLENELSLVFGKDVNDTKGHFTVKIEDFNFVIVPANEILAAQQSPLPMLRDWREPVRISSNELYTFTYMSLMALFYSYGKKEEFELLEDTVEDFINKVIYHTYGIGTTTVYPREMYYWFEEIDDANWDLIQVSDFDYKDGDEPESIYVGYAKKRGEECEVILYIKYCGKTYKIPRSYPLYRKESSCFAYKRMIYFFINAVAKVNIPLERIDEFLTELYKNYEET